VRVVGGHAGGLGPGDHDLGREIIRAEPKRHDRHDLCIRVHQSAAGFGITTE